MKRVCSTISHQIPGGQGSVWTECKRDSEGHVRESSIKKSGKLNETDDWFCPSLLPPSSPILHHLLVLAFTELGLIEYKIKEEGLLVDKAKAKTTNLPQFP